MAQPPPPPIATATDQPPLPRRRWSWLTKLWVLAMVGSIGAYSVGSFFGWDLRTTERDEVPVSVRSSPGGYRSFHFWHSGYHGGK